MTEMLSQRATHCLGETDQEGHGVRVALCEGRLGMYSALMWGA